MGVQRRRGRGLKAWDPGRRETTAKVLKDRRSPRSHAVVWVPAYATRFDSISIRSRFDLDSGIRTIGRAPSSAVVSSVSAAIAASAVAATSPARDARGERRVRRGEAGGRNERMNRRRPRTAPGEKVLNDRRSRRERGRVGTSVNGADRARGRGGTRGPDPSNAGDRDAARGSSDAPVVSVVVAAAGVALGGPRAVRHRPPRRDVPASARPRANRSVLLVGRYEIVGVRVFQKKQSAFGSRD